MPTMASDAKRDNSGDTGFAFGAPGEVSWAMSFLSVFWLVACIGGLALSLKSAAVLGVRSRATALGWVLTAAYFAIAAVDVLRATRPPLHLDYVLLAALTAAFIVAGVRDEPQAEPWWWPSASGLTGKERRAKKT